MKIPNFLRLVAGLGLALAATSPFVAPVLAAPAQSTTTATITVYARGGSLGQPVVVQWGDAIGGWHNVGGWTGSLDHLSSQGVPFTRFTLFSDIFGKGPFRWVIYFSDGVTPWAVGPSFNLPTIAGSDYSQPFNQQTNTPPSLATPTPAPTSVPGVPSLAPDNVPHIKGDIFTYGLGSGTDSKITVLIGGWPKTIWIAVQWLDGYGVWRTVDGWQGGPTSVDAQGVLSQQWDIPPALFGTGPFRWALYDYSGGPLIGVSPSFNMPPKARLNQYMTLAPYFE